MGRRIDAALAGPPHMAQESLPANSAGEIGTLPEKILTFTASIIDATKDPGGETGRDVHIRFVYGHTLAAYQTAKAYWVLRQAGEFYPGAILGRALMESYFSIAAADVGPQNSCGMIVTDIKKREKTLRLMREMLTNPASVASIDARISEAAADRQIFEALLTTGTTRDWTTFERAAAQGVQDIYRTAYAELSEYAHANFRKLVEPMRNTEPFADLAALSTPLHGAHCLYHAVNGAAEHPTCDAYWSLFEDTQNWRGAAKS